MQNQSFEHDGLRLFTELLDIPSPSGFEAQMAAVLHTKLTAQQLQPSIDASGNLLVRLPGGDRSRPSIYYAAHMDEIGMTVRGIQADGSLRVQRLGGLFPWKIGETAVTILGDNGEISGVLSLGSGHSRRVVEAGPSWETARVLTGRSVSSLMAEGVRVGSAVVPARETRGPVLVGEAASPWVGAWTFDNRLAITACLLAISRMQTDGAEPRSPTTLAFTVEEEIGCLGAKGLAHRERPDVLIAIDGSPLVPECPVPLDGHPAIRARDRLALYDQALLGEILRASSESGVDLHTVVYDGAASDASAVYAAGACSRAACLGYVRDSSHGYEVTPLDTFDLLTQTITALFMQL